MIFKIRIAHWRFTFTFAPVTDVTGVNSNLPNDKHICMWDFDNVTLDDVIVALQLVRYHYCLPNIYILNTGKPDHHIAYCFKAMPWRDSVQIVASTADIDPNFFKYGVYRSHWTLRVTPKEGRKPKLVKILHSPIKEDCSIDELNSWVKGTPMMQHHSIPASLHHEISFSYFQTCPPKIRNARRCYAHEEV